jgi:hypothetical protein
MGASEIDAIILAAEEPVDDLALAQLPRNDVGNGERFMAPHGYDVRETQRFGLSDDPPE